MHRVVHAGSVVLAGSVTAAMRLPYNATLFVSPSLDPPTAQPSVAETIETLMSGAPG